jgi:hypothetical protein
LRSTPPAVFFAQLEFDNALNTSSSFFAELEFDIALNTFSSFFA